MPDAPLVSVITVVLNARATLQQCMDSVYAQTYRNIEYVIVDGGSTDGTIDLIQANSERLDYFVSQVDSGIYDAMNKGVSLASGDYIIFLNSDDWYENTAIEDLVDAANRSRADVVHADAWVVNSLGIVYDRRNGWVHDGLYTHHMPIRHETMLVASHVYKRYGLYDATYKINADYEFVTRLYGQGCSFSHVPKPLLYFRATGISSKRRAELFQERATYFKSVYPFLDSSELAWLAKGLTNKQRGTLINRHRDKSARFAASLTSMMAAQPSKLLRLLKSFDHTPAKPLLVLARWARFIAVFFRSSLGRFRR